MVDDTIPLSENLSKMEWVRICIQSALRHVEELYVKRSEDEQTSVRQFVAHITQSYSPMAMFSEINIRRIANEVFTNDKNYRYIINLTFQWVSRWNGSDEDFTELANTLARACSFSRSSSSLVPSDLTDRLWSKEDIAELLLNNHWLITIVLLKLYVFQE